MARKHREMLYPVAWLSRRWRSCSGSLWGATGGARQRQESAPTPVQIRSLSVDGGAARKNTGTVKWDYPRPGTPGNWADLSEEFRTCAEGVEQSPVDLTGYTTVVAAPIVSITPACRSRHATTDHTVYLD